ncbi:MAG: TetR/AcrR family transcriptional regulator [Phototrophicaceae bacterium]
MTDAPLWNPPKQARSQQRFDHILTVAASLFAERGLEHVTTNHIAEQAAVPIGSLYQFFPNKEALLAALIHHYQGLLAEVFVEIPFDQYSFPQAVGQVVDGLLRFDQHQPAFGMIFMGLDHSPYQPLTMHVQNAIVQSVEGLLAYYQPQFTDHQRHQCALVGYAVVKGMMGIPPEQMAREDLAREIKTVLVGYVTTFAQRVTSNTE